MPQQPLEDLPNEKKVENKSDNNSANNKTLLNFSPTSNSKRLAFNV